MSENFYKNQGVRMAIKFKVDGTLTDPTSVSFFTQSPGGTQTEYEVRDPNTTAVKNSTGNYYVDVTVNTVGNWVFKALGTTACQASYVETFVVTSGGYA